MGRSSRDRRRSWSSGPGWGGCGPSARPKHRDECVAVASLPVDSETCKLRQRLAFGVLGEDGGGRGRAVQLLQRAVQDHVVIGRVEEHEIGRGEEGGLRLEPMDDVTPNYLRSLLESEGVQVLPQDSKTARLLIHERDVRRPARKRFDPKRAGAREEIEHLGALDAWADHVEDRLLDHVLGRPDVFRRLEAAAAGLAAGDPELAHALTRIKPSPRMTPILSPCLKRPAWRGGIATSNPPLVCASQSISCSVSPSPPHSTRSRKAAWLRLLPSGNRSRSARLPTPLMKGTESKSRSAPPAR